MFYDLSKLGGVFLNTGNLLAIAALFGLIAHLARWRRLGRALYAISALGMLLIGGAPTGDVLLSRLESRFPPLAEDRPFDGIVALGGALDPVRYFWRPGTGMNPAVGRYIEAARLARDNPAARVIIAGGGADHDDGAMTEGAAARDLLISLGVDASRITLELDSRNTCENAYFLKRIAQPKPGERWALVTSAFHMARAMGCFRTEHFDVVADPADFRATPNFPLSVNFNAAGNIERFDLAVHEMTGLLIYRLSGRIPALFPGP